MNRKKGKPSAARPRTRRPPREPEPLTPLQLARENALRSANGGRGVTKQGIVDALAARGVSISRQSVSFVLRDKFRNDDVIAEFCRLTNTAPEIMFPIDDARGSHDEREPTRAAS